MKDELLQWSKFLRENFDKLLILILYMYLMGFMVHASYSGKSEALISYIMQAATGAAGALYIMLTGKKVPDGQKGPGQNPQDTP